MLWAVPAKSPVAPRALAVLAFFLLLTLYLTWPLPLRMGSGLSTNPDSLLNSHRDGRSAQAEPRRDLERTEVRGLPEEASRSRHLPRLPSML